MSAASARARRFQTIEVFAIAAVDIKAHSRRRPIPYSAELQMSLQVPCPAYVTNA